MGSLQVGFLRGLTAPNLDTYNVLNVVCLPISQ